MGWGRKVVCAFVKVAQRIVYRLKIEGLENIPKEGAAVLCANHVHAFDSVLCGANIKRMVYAMAKEELFKTKFKNKFMREMGCFPVKRGAAGEEAINRALEILDGGDLLLIFPEGTRNGLAKGVKPKKGAALIAVKAKVPIIPIGFNGTFKLFSKVTIRIGKPINLSKYYEVDSIARCLPEITNNVMGEVLELAK